MKENSVEEFYDKFATTYDEDLMGETMCYSGPDRTLRFLKPHLDENHIRVLELGVGTGLFAELLTDLGMEVYGIDISESMIEECRKKGFARDLCVSDIEGGVELFPDVNFDVVASVGVLELLPDITGVVADVAGRLQTGGLFCFTAPTIEGNPEVELEMADGQGVDLLTFERTGIKARFRSDDYLGRLLKSNRFDRIERQRFTGFRGKSTGVSYQWDVFVARKK